MSDTAQPSFKDKMMKILGKFSGSRFVRAIMGAGYFDYCLFYYWINVFGLNSFNASYYC